MGEETDHLPAPGGRAGGVDQAEATPEQRRAGARGQLPASGHQLAPRAVLLQNLAGGRPPEGDAVAVHRHPLRQVGQTHFRQNAGWLLHPTHHGRPQFRQPGRRQGGDFRPPHFQRRLAAVPVGHPPNPFRDQHFAVGQAVGHRKTAPVNHRGFPARRGQGHQGAGAHFLQGDGVSQHRAQGRRIRGRGRGRFGGGGPCGCRRARREEKNLLERALHQGTEPFPFPPAVAQLAVELPHVAGAFGVGLQAAGRVRMLQ